jgi:hypothetical protein
LQQIIGRPIRVVNDADCFASSEATDGAGAGYSVVFGVIIASGTGAGVAIDGRAHHGPNNSAGDSTIFCTFQFGSTVAWGVFAGLNIMTFSITDVNILWKYKLFLILFSTE